jgi:hypothetical protein
MNKLPAVLILIGIAACDRKPFVDHKIKFEKVADNCGEKQDYFRMTSNFGGERYEFEKCLPAGFKESDLQTSRKGDTVVVNFPSASTAQAGVVFHVTLDIDSYPRYRFLELDKDVFTISSPEK